MDAIRSMRLQAVRCTQCGDARWSLFSSADPAKPCDLCGGEMKPERRMPGSGPAGSRASAAAASRRAPLPR